MCTLPGRCGLITHASADCRLAMLLDPSLGEFSAAFCAEGTLMVVRGHPADSARRQRGC